MALKPQETYPSQTVSSDDAYPYGKAKNRAGAGDATGTPLEKHWLNDLWGFEQALLVEAGLTPSGTPDKYGASQYLEALKTVIDALVTGASGTTYDSLKALLADAIVTPGTMAVPLVWTVNQDDRFGYLTGVTNERVFQSSVASAGTLIIPFTLPYKCLKLNADSCNLYLKGTAGHGALPGTMPTLALYRSVFDPVTPDANAELLGSATDDSMDVAAYEAYHSFGPEFDAIDPLKPWDQYFAVITGETGANAKTGMDIWALTLTLSAKTF